MLSFILRDPSLFVLGLIWSEVKQLWDIGLHEYINDMWNVIDFVTNSLYVATVALRVVSYFQVIYRFYSVLCLSFRVVHQFILLMMQTLNKIKGSKRHGGTFGCC